MIDKNKEFYPTPSALAFKAKGLFKNKKIARLLEPSAGRGNLLEPFLTGNKHYWPKIDCIELDFDNQAILRAKGLTVIDADFMQFEGASLYSHILLNPPFSQGAEHVIKAYNLLFNGEVVAIVNAETIKNPCTKARKFLCGLIKDHGTVEFVESAFTDPDTLRKTSVEVALIWLERKNDIKTNFTHGLEIDKVAGLHYEHRQELAIKGNVISNTVAVFNAAVNAAKAASIAGEEADYYKTLLGNSLNQGTSYVAISPDSLTERFNVCYDDLKQRAWTAILNSTEFSKYLSSKAYEKLVADFEFISKLSFTESNIRGFLLGLVNSQSEMNMQMVLDCFDEITKYRPENRAYYRGWKSNQKHKEQAFRVMMTRFIIPAQHSFFQRLDYRALKKLEDFDKTFAMLDGKAKCEKSLYDLFEKRFDELKGGKRVSTSYFDIRYYSGVGSIHFYPTNKAVIDRLNRMVGKERQWLPEDESKAPKEFWDQYNKAETVTKAMIIPNGPYRYCNQVPDDVLIKSHLQACESIGVNVSGLLASC